MKITDKEKEIISAILQTKHPLLDALRSQIDTLEVFSREFTGAGFFTCFGPFPKDWNDEEKKRYIHIGFATGSMPNVERGVGFDLLVVDAKIHQLEGFSYEEPFPDNLDGLELNKSGLPPEVIKEMDEYWLRFTSK